MKNSLASLNHVVVRISSNFFLLNEIIIELYKQCEQLN